MYRRKRSQPAGRGSTVLSPHFFTSRAPTRSRAYGSRATHQVPGAGVRRKRGKLPQHPHAREILAAEARESARQAPPARQVEIVVQCPPGWGKNNSRYAYRSSKTLSDDYETYRDYVRLAWLAAGRPVFVFGPVGVSITAYWTRMRKLDFETPFADVDALDKGTLDALVEAGCLDTDMRVVDLRLRKAFDAKNPRVEIVLWTYPSYPNSEPSLPRPRKSEKSNGSP